MKNNIQDRHSMWGTILICFFSDSRHRLHPWGVPTGLMGSSSKPVNQWVSLFQCVCSTVGMASGHVLKPINKGKHDG